MEARVFDFWWASWSSSTPPTLIVLRILIPRTLILAFKLDEPNAMV
jgi:hypothetical protein